jgi:hypothetical protein
VRRLLERGRQGRPGVGGLIPAEHGEWP